MDRGAGLRGLKGIRPAAEPHCEPARRKMPPSLYQLVEGRWNPRQGSSQVGQGEPPGPNKDLHPVSI